MLFLQPTSSYLLFYTDNPTDYEKTQIEYWLKYLPVDEGTLIRLIYFSIPTKMLAQDSTLDIIQQLVYRAAILKRELESKNIICDTLKAEHESMLHAILSLSTYHVQLPQDVKMKNTVPIAIRSWFWQALIIVIIIASLNPVKLGKIAWNVITKIF